MPFFHKIIMTAKLLNPCFHKKTHIVIRVILLIKTKNRVNVFKSEIKRVSFLTKPPVSRCTHTMILKNDDGTF